MIESNNPNIDVDELMQQVQDKVARRQKNSLLAETSIFADGTNGGSIGYVETLLKEADFYYQV